MPDREKVLAWLEICGKDRDCSGCCPYGNGTGEDNMSRCREDLMADALALLKEQKNEYINGFNDAMLGKRELMYEGIDGKWYKKDW